MIQENHIASAQHMLVKICGLFVGCLIAAPLWGEVWSSEHLTPAEARGQQIYLTGESPSNHEIAAFLNAAQMEVPGSLFACVRCHGNDGRGKTEGGVTSSDIRWSVLTKPYGGRHPSGRQYPPYNESHIKRAIMLGTDSKGTELHETMPRFRLSQQDMEDLLAYLKRLGQTADPGINPSTVTVGVTLFPSKTYAALNQALTTSLQAYVDRFNERGGIYNRKLELTFLPLSPETSTWQNQLETHLERQDVFALTGVFMDGANEAITEWANARKLPVVGGISLFPQREFSRNRYVFYLYPGLAEQAQALVHFAEQQKAALSLTSTAPPKPSTETTAANLPQTAVNLPQTAANQTAANLPQRAKASKQSRVGVLVSPEFQGSDEVQTLHDQLWQAGWREIEIAPLPNRQTKLIELVQRWHQGDRNVVFLWVGGPPALHFLEEASELGWQPSLYIPGVLNTPNFTKALPRFAGDVFFSFPSRWFAPSTHHQATLQRLAATYHLTSEHWQMQLRVLAGVQLLVEGLTRMGREVTREKLVTTLEGFYEFQTGISPPVTFTPNRRVGARGAYIGTFDAHTQQWVQVGQWMESQ